MGSCASDSMQPKRAGKGGEDAWKILQTTNIKKKIPACTYQSYQSEKSEAGLDGSHFGFSCKQGNSEFTETLRLGKACFSSISYLPHGTDSRRIPDPHSPHSSTAQPQCPAPDEKKKWLGVCSKRRKEGTNQPAPRTSAHLAQTSGVHPLGSLLPDSGMRSRTKSKPRKATVEEWNTRELTTGPEKQFVLALRRTCIDAFIVTAVPIKAIHRRHVVLFVQPFVVK